MRKRYSSDLSSAAPILVSSTENGLGLGLGLLWLFFSALLRYTAPRYYFYSYAPRRLLWCASIWMAWRDCAPADGVWVRLDLRPHARLGHERSYVFPVWGM